MPIDSKLLMAGTRHVRAGEFARARDVFQQLLAGDPGDATIHNWLGVACLGLEQAKEAAVHLAEAVRLDPALAIAHENMGQLLVAQNRFAEAATSLRSAAALEPRNAALRLKWAHALVKAG